MWSVLDLPLLPWINQRVLLDHVIDSGKGDYNSWLVLIIIILILEVVGFPLGLLW